MPQEVIDAFKKELWLTAITPFPITQCFLIFLGISHAVRSISYLPSSAFSFSVRAGTTLFRSPTMP